MKKLSFKEYYENKMSLLESAPRTVVFSTTHQLQKYCKLPLLEGTHKHQYSFKPNDIIVMEWQRSDSVITPLNITICDKLYRFQWSAEKMKKWVESSTTQKITP